MTSASGGKRSDLGLTSWYTVEGEKKRKGTTEIPRRPEYRSHASGESEKKTSDRRS